MSTCALEPALIPLVDERETPEQLAERLYSAEADPDPVAFAARCMRLYGRHALAEGEIEDAVLRERTECLQIARTKRTAKAAADAIEARKWKR